MSKDRDVITCQNLTFFYPKTEKPAVRNANLHVKEGEFLAITGPSGAGKTTFCLTLNSLIPHVAVGKLIGNVVTLGMNTREYPVHEFSKVVGIVLQDPESQFLVGTVKYDIVYALENLLTPREEMLKRLKSALKITRLEGFEDRLSYHLSGGQKQRVAIAAGLTLTPKILILDEPTSELDPIGKTEVLSTVKELNEKHGMTIILVTHEIERVIDYADRIVVMHKGQIVAEGEPRKVLIEQIDKIREIGVKIPQVAEVGVLLEKRGMIRKIPLNIQEAFTLFSDLKLETKQISIKAVSIAEKSQIIEVKGLWFTYPEPPITALRDINLKIYQGDRVGIIGQNGSGKTTLVKHLNGLLKPTEGQVIVDGRDTKNATVGELSAKVGYVFQNPDHQIFSNTVREEVSFGPKNLGFSKEEIERSCNMALKTLGLTEVADENPFFLSKGERERVALAAVMAMKPKVLIVDEPTTGQDWKTSMEIMEECEKLNAMGTTIITISHDMRLIAQTMKRVIVMAQGRVLLDGSAKEIFSKPDVLKETFLEPPQITMLSQKLRDYGYPKDILTTSEMLDFIGIDST